MPERRTLVWLGVGLLAGLLGGVLAGLLRAPASRAVPPPAHAAGAGAAP